MISTSVSAIEVRLYRFTPVHVSAIFDLYGDMKQIVWPPSRPKTRTDNLWQTTCLEVFIKDLDGIGYSEFNLSPSGQWAAYAFADYRHGGRPLELAVPPDLRVEGERDEEIIFEVRLTLPKPTASEVALSAVIEESDGAKSYWALAHPPGKPDFHDPACFTATLPAPPRA